MITLYLSLKGNCYLLTNYIAKFIVIFFIRSAVYILFFVIDAMIELIVFTYHLGHFEWYNWLFKCWVRIFQLLVELHPFSI